MDPFYNIFKAKSLPGGWSTADIDSENIKNVSEWVITTQFENQPSYSIVYAEQQVVAGVNYKLVLAVIIAGKREMWEFIIYDHFGKYSLTSSKIL
jgi:hypothetical protein